MIEEIKHLILSQKGINDEFVINYNVDEYVLKIYKYATILPYYSESQLKGFIAYYSNDIITKSAYLTMILIDREFQGEGIGKLLLESSISDLVHRGFHNYKLEVSKNNKKALTMYLKYSFVIQEDRGDLWLLNLQLNKFDK